MYIGTEIFSVVKCLFHALCILTPVLCGMYLSGGLTATIIKITMHYVVRLKINGKYYFTDCSGSNGGKVNKPFGTVWTVNGRRTNTYRMQASPSVLPRG